MPVLTKKNVFDPAEGGDGLRLLATRYWPRGVTRGHVDLYVPDLAPTRDLLRQFLDAAIPWRKFASAYRAEMKGQKSLIRLLRHLDRRGETITLLCTCETDERCHRRLLAELVAKVD